MHICFYNHGLGDTGGVRIMLDLSVAFMERGARVSIIVNNCSDLAYRIPRDISIYRIFPGGLEPQGELSQTRVNAREGKVFDVLARNGLIIKSYLYAKYLLFRLRLFVGKNRLKEKLKTLEVDHFISLNMYNSLEYSYIFGDVANCILHFHNDIEDVVNRSNFVSWVGFEDLLNRFRVICVCEEQRRRLRERFPLTVGKIDVIYNPVNCERIYEMSQREVLDDENYLIVVAGLTVRKRIDRALRALALLDDEKLIVLGDGPLRGELKAMARELGVEDRVCFKGFIENPYPFIKRARCLILTSDYEGLPTVLIEAHVLGVPAISLDCPTGPREILTGIHSRLLIEISSEEDIVDQLKNRIEEIKYNRAEFLKFDLSFFSQKSVIDKWLVVFQDEVGQGAAH